MPASTTAAHYVCVLCSSYSQVAASRVGTQEVSRQQELGMKWAEKQREQSKFLYTKDVICHKHVCCKFVKLPLFTHLAQQGDINTSKRRGAAICSYYIA